VQPVKPIIVIRKKSGHGGAWQVAYADFVTALRLRFIVLWLLNTSGKVRQAVAGHFNDPRGKTTLTGTDPSGGQPRPSRHRKQHSRAEVSEARGYADQKLRLPQSPFDPSNRRTSLVVQYLTAKGGAPPPAASETGVSDRRLVPGQGIAYSNLITAHTTSQSPRRRRCAEKQPGGDH
jgi:flagellar motor protein MotB